MSPEMEEERGSSGGIKECREERSEHTNLVVQPPILQKQRENRTLSSHQPAGLLYVCTEKNLTEVFHSLNVLTQEWA